MMSEVGPPDRGDVTCVGPMDTQKQSGSTLQRLPKSVGTHTCSPVSRTGESRALRARVDRGSLGSLASALRWLSSSPSVVCPLGVWVGQLILVREGDHPIPVPSDEAAVD